MSRAASQQVLQIRRVEGLRKGARQIALSSGDGDDPDRFSAGQFQPGLGSLGRRVFAVEDNAFAPGDFGNADRPLDYAARPRAKDQPAPKADIGSGLDADQNGRDWAQILHEAHLRARRKIRMKVESRFGTQHEKTAARSAAGDDIWADGVCRQTTKRGVPSMRDLKTEELSQVYGAGGKGRSGGGCGSGGSKSKKSKKSMSKKSKKRNSHGC
jgi:hypothetical protein